MRRVATRVLIGLIGTGCGTGSDPGAGASDIRTLAGDVRYLQQQAGIRSWVLEFASEPDRYVRLSLIAVVEDRVEPSLSISFDVPPTGAATGRIWIRYLDRDRSSGQALWSILVESPGSSEHFEWTAAAIPSWSAAWSARQSTGRMLATATSAEIWRLRVAPYGPTGTALSYRLALATLPAAEAPADGKLRQLAAGSR
ncbi:MAG: hypothetical protein AB7L66_05750 [Gemmatimonadales bacterium]